MNLEQNKALIRQFFDASSNADVAAMTALWAPDAVNHGRYGNPDRPEQRPPSGPEGLRRVFESLRIAFPDRQWHVEDMIAEGDKVVCRLTVSGTHQGVPPIPVEGALLSTIPATGNHYETQHIHIFRISGDKIAEHWAARDDLGMLEQLGVISGEKGAQVR